MAKRQMTDNRQQKTRKRRSKSSHASVDKDSFGGRMCEVRRAKKMTQYALGRQLGYRAGVVISNFEFNKCKLWKIEKLKKLSSVLDVDLHWLITGQPSPIKALKKELLRRMIKTRRSKLVSEILDLLVEKILEGEIGPEPQDKEPPVLKINTPIDCPMRFRSGVMYTCSAVEIGKIVCDNESTDGFDFPKECPLRQGTVLVKSEIADGEEKEKRKTRAG